MGPMAGASAAHIEDLFPFYATICFPVEITKVVLVSVDMLISGLIFQVP